MQNAILVFSRNAKQAGLIARTLRCREVPCFPLPLETSAREALASSPRGVILAADACDANALDGLDFSLLTADVPVLALGGAAAVLCAHFGGSFQPLDMERRAVTLSLSENALFTQLVSGERMLGDIAELSLPDSLLPIATATERVIGYRHAAMNLYGMQYPIERNDPDAAQLLYNFATDLCGVEPLWTDDRLIDTAVERIRGAAPEGRVLCAVSGGVDSAVCAKLASMAVGDRLTCIFVDTGLFRQNEPEEVIRAYREALGLELARVDATDFFLRTLSGIGSPRKKEHTAARLMRQVLLRQLDLTPDIHTIVTGTNLNDVLYGLAGGDEPPLGGAAICEPIAELFKEEVRRVAGLLGLPEDMATRQPFPASGLALRVRSGITEEKLRLLREADAYFAEEIREGGHDRRLWQYYAMLMEDTDREGCFIICLRASQSGQSGAYAARLPFDVLERTAQRIRESIPSVTRVVYDLTPSAHYGELE